MGKLNNRGYVGFWTLALSLIFLFSANPYSAASDYWPTDGWRMSAPEDQGMHSNVLADMLEKVQESGHNIDSISIVRNGYLVSDAYFYPYPRDQKHVIHSCTKSIMSALIGIAVDKRYIKDVNQPIMAFFPNKTPLNLDERKQSITLENLLTMASGLKCRDSYRYKWVGLTEMRSSNDWIQYMLDLPMAEPPGQRFEYCNGASFLLSAIIQKTTHMKTLDFARKHLFGPLGISDIRWKTNPQGIDIGWGEMGLKPHDMAKIGWLYLNKGRWGNQQIIPAEWIEVSTRGHIEATLFSHYGYQWWVDADGYFMAVGYRGQFIFVVPDKNMVVVFTSYLSGSDFFIPKQLLGRYIIPAAISTSPLPSNPDGKQRLDALESRISKPHPFIWPSEKEGVARDGVFKRTASPAFKFAYPPGSKKGATKSPRQIMRMKTHRNVPFVAAITDVPEGWKPIDFGPKFYAPGLERVGTNIRIISNKEITLKCGTRAYRTDIKWLWKNCLQFTTIVVSALKDGKCVYIAVHPWQDPEEVASIPESLTFE